MSIKVALSCLAILALGQIAMAIHDWNFERFPLINIVLGIGISGLLALGIYRGNRLAWQWARITSLIGTILAILFIGFGFSVLLLIHVRAVTGLFVSLGRKDALEHFRLVCPDCGSKKTMTGGLLLNTNSCRTCEISSE